MSQPVSQPIAGRAPRAPRAALDRASYLALPLAERRALIARLYTQDQLSQAAIARALGISAATVSRAIAAGFVTRDGDDPFGGATLTAELLATQRVTQALAPLPLPARRRVLDYVRDRLNATAHGPLDDANASTAGHSGHSLSEP